MEQPTVRTAMRIYLDEGDRSHGRPLFALIVDFLRERGCPGACVLRGIEGFGAHARISASSAIDAASSMPIVIEVIDADAHVRGLIPKLCELLGSGGMIALQSVDTLIIPGGSA